MARPKVKTSTFLFEFTPQFEQDMIDVAKEVADWEAVLTHFGVPFVDSIIESEKLIGCSICKNRSSIQLSLKSPKYPRWRCRTLCEHSVGGGNFISLLGLFNDDKSPRQLLDEVQRLFCARTVKPTKPRKTKPVPANKPNTVRPNKKTAPVSSRAYSHLDGAIFPTKHPQKA